MEKKENWDEGEKEGKRGKAKDQVVLVVKIIY